MLQVAIDVLAAVGAATGVRHSALVYVIVSASHVLGIALLLGPILLVDLRLLGLLRSLGPDAVSVLRSTAKIGVAIAITTGVLLLSANPAEYARKAVVWWKLAVVGAALLNAIAYELTARDGGMERISATARRAFGAASLALWLTALGLGRAIAFT